MPDRPNYHHAPYTLDANRDIPDDAALSAGHDEDEAEKVKAADEEHTEGVQAVEQAEAKRAEQQDENPTPSEFEASQQAAPPSEEKKSSKGESKSKSSK